MLAVIACSFWDNTFGGFVGIDVFFVLSGFLVTASLFRAGKHSKTMEGGHFLWGRVLRILPAATVVRLWTYAASLLVFSPGRTDQIGIDALLAAVFTANFHFAALGADPFAGPMSASPLQHYWALAVGEQFWLVWPLLVLTAAMIAAAPASSRPSASAVHS